MKQKRIESGYSQRKLSLILDNTPTFVSKYESGERYLLFTEAILICEILGIDAHELTDTIINALRADSPLHTKTHPPDISGIQKEPTKTPPTATCNRRSLHKKQ